MKALIISDEQNIIDTLDSFLQSKGFDTIIYRWLLKAMDNIEEIRPELVIVSSQEYPRHWKTLCQFAKSGIGADKTSVILFQNNALSEEELEKATSLGVSGTFYNLNQDGLFDLENILKKENLLVKNEIDPSENEESEEDQIITVESVLSDTFDNEEPAQESTLPEDAALIFTNPNTNALVICKILTYKDQTCTLAVENDDLTKDLLENDLISNITIQMDKIVDDYRGFVVSNNGNLVLAVEKADDE